MNDDRMLNRESRRLDAEQIRQEFIKSTKFKLTQRPLYPRIGNPMPKKAST